MFEVVCCGCFVLVVVVWLGGLFVVFVCVLVNGWVVVIFDVFVGCVLLLGVVYWLIVGKLIMLEFVFVYWWFEKVFVVWVFLCMMLLVV